MEVGIRLEREMAGHKSDFPSMNSFSEPGVGCTKGSIEASFVSPLPVVLHMGANVVAHQLAPIRDLIEASTADFVEASSVHCP